MDRTIASLHVRTSESTAEALAVPNPRFRMFALRKPDRAALGSTNERPLLVTSMYGCSWPGPVDHLTGSFRPTLAIGDFLAH
jgi:hypothetical protein